MAYSSYKISQQLSAFNPIDKTLSDKAKQVEYLYGLAMDREKDCKLNNLDFVKSPRIFNRKKYGDTQVITVETIDISDRFKCGDMLSFDNNFWLCLSGYVFHQLYCRGEFVLTNYNLIFQHPTTGAILSYPCIDEKFSKSIGEDQGKFITTLNAVHRLILPLDKITVLLRNGKRFFLDKHPTKPQSVKVTDVDTTSKDGLLILTVERDEYNPLKDRIDLGVCDYFEPLVEPEPTDPEVPQIIVKISSNISNNEVKLGLTYSFTATFTNELGELVTSTQPIYTIDNTYGGKINLIDNLDGTCTIKVKENAYDLLGNQFTLQCMDMYSGFSSTITLVIVSFL